MSLSLFILLVTMGKIRGKVIAASGTVSLYLSYIAALLLALWHLMPGRSFELSFLFGSIIQLSGVLLRLAGLKRLGRYYSSFVEIRESQRIVTDGIYSIIRHPLHCAFLLEIAGMGIISENLFSILPFLISWITIILRNRKEEKTMLDHFGKEYERYIEAVPSMNIALGIIKRLERKNRRSKNDLTARK
jgi:protein-S-isoprenylcysteine O-methyltransferase Ste14